MGIVFVSGVPGAGKTTLCEEVRDEYGLEYLNIGSFLGEYVEEHGSEVGFDDELDSYLRSLEDDLLLDTHAVEKESYGYRHHAFEGLSDLDVEGYVFVDSDPETVYERRERDEKDRDAETVEEIEEHRRYLKQVVVGRATRDEVPSFMLKNDGSVEAGVSGMEEILAEMDVV